MGFQESINSALGTAAGVIGKVNPGKADKLQAQTGFKSKTADFKNFDNNTVNKSAESLKREIEGKKAQDLRIKKRVEKVRQPKVKPDFTKPITKGMSFD